ncbi:hypothetical protein FisN_30Lh052 [Fistulifera solaris]|uniref:Uncharacterized protein n=1 Tax=Fistulifera solaris TaxID=1519565 RepID=A0A1Z5JID1_FISSO|nr:hypothetical protein FisN_30Lh052 [Fistulifera solaris]|eukprot:GAX13764.1 hypothetical protein FisN_30Lh052 [Fistulifera solaris]
MNSLSALLYIFLAATATAFAPSNQPKFQRARLISGRPQLRFMSEDPNSEVSKAPQGTFYDDEVNPDSYAPKVGISDSMRERLKREASRGLDSEQKQTNVILYISIAVALLVVAGGSGILY